MVIKVLDRCMNSILLKNGDLRFSFRPEWFVDLFKAVNGFFLDFD